MARACRDFCRRGLVLAGMLLLVGAWGCEGEEEARREEGERIAEEQSWKEQIGEVAREARETAMAELREKLDDLEEKIKELEAREDFDSDEARQEWQEKRAQLREQLERARAELQELRQAGSDRWEEMREDFGEVYEELQQAYREAAESWRES